MNTIRKHHLVTVFYCNGSATIKHLAFRLLPPPPSPGQQTHSPAPTRKLTVESIGTLMRFQNFAVSLLSKTHRSLPVHTTVLMRFRLFTLKRSKTIDIARCDVSWTLCACYKHTRLRYFWSFWCVFDCPHYCEMYAFSQERAFLSQCVFDENAQRISMDRRVKRIEMYAFSNENTSV